jgi:hypothetical protein
MMNLKPTQPWILLNDLHFGGKGGCRLKNIVVFINYSVYIELEVI